ncbi:MAG: oligoendopeptidase F [Bacteroidota bacterium]|jgi:oligoendopeptidase F|nr:oligoendopeptidase F [Bacteroidota bacterium]
MTTQGVLPSREDLDPRYTWRLADLYPTDAAWENDFSALEALIAEIPAFRGTLGRSAGDLLRWLRQADEIMILSGALGNYAFRRYDEDTTRTAAQAKMDRVLSQHARLAAETAWVVPELLEISDVRIREFLDTHPDLAVYAHHLEEVLRMKPHTLDSAQERLLAMSGDALNAPSTIFSMFNDADIRFGTIENEDGAEVEVTKGRYLQLQESRDRRVREDAYRTLYSRYGEWKNTLGATFGGQVKREMFYARARGYASTRAMALYEDNIPVTVYDNVIHTVRDHLAPLHRSIALRRRLLALDTVRPWDLYVPLASETKIRFPYHDAVAVVGEALAVLGSTYRDDLESGLHGGWIDVYENQGKTSGAYSAWTYGSHPFVLLNYTETLKDVFTLAHEMGHAMHSYYTGKHQPPVYGGYTIFCAEVASTCNEMLLVDHMLRTRPERDLQLHLLFHYIDTIRGTVYNQALFAEFEQFAHAQAEDGVPLTVDLLGTKMGALYQEYYGADFTMDEAYAINWARIPHFYRSFYVFQYATGLSAAIALSRRILAGDADALPRYLRFLQSGSSAYSIDLLRDAGVDMERPEPIAAAAALMDDLLDRVESLL